MLMRNEEKVNALAGVAAISAVVAMVLILLNLSLVIPLVSSLASQVPAPPNNFDDLAGQLTRLQIQQPNAMESVALLGIASFLVLSLTSTVAVSRIARQSSPKSLA
jgi:hypothetical protein